MKILLRLTAACLVLCLVLPTFASAGGGLGEDPYEIGRKLLAGKHYKTALSYFQKALQRNDVRAHYGLGLANEAVGKDREALGHYRQFIELGPPDDERNQAVQRVAAIEERSEKKATRTSELLERGKSLFANGKYREAEQALLKAAAADDSQPEVHFYLGEVYLQLLEYDKAKSEYRKAKRNY